MLVFSHFTIYCVTSQRKYLGEHKDRDEVILDNFLGVVGELYLLIIWL